MRVLLLTASLTALLGGIVAYLIASVPFPNAAVAVGILAGFSVIAAHTLVPYSASRRNAMLVGQLDAKIRVVTEEFEADGFFSLKAIDSLLVAEIEWVAEITRASVTFGRKDLGDPEEETAGNLAPSTGPSIVLRAVRGRRSELLTARRVEKVVSAESLSVEAWTWIGELAKEGAFFEQNATGLAIVISTSFFDRRRRGNVLSNLPISSLFSALEETIVAFCKQKGGA